MRSLKDIAINSGWLESDEYPLAPRLGFPLDADLPDVVHDFNRPTRDRVVRDMFEGLAQPVANPSPFGPEPQIVVAEVDRYGIPLRTVLGANTGLMRSDPYYDDDYLVHFYREHYRSLYRPKRFSEPWFFAEQVRGGQRILERVSEKLAPRARVLDIGCGMGGMLLAFKFAGFSTIGCDHGEDYAARGRSLGLDIRIGGPESVAGEGPFDLIILSHVLEHTSDPIQFLRETAALLKPRGACYIEVPGLLNLDRYYEGNLLLYLQNAHRWHFTSQTLRAVARRAGLDPGDCDQAITCLASLAAADHDAMPADGDDVIDEIQRLEQVIAARSANVVRAA